MLAKTFYLNILWICPALQLMAYSLRMVYFLHHENDSLQWMSFALKNNMVVTTDTPNMMWFEWNAEFVTQTPPTS